MTVPFQIPAYFTVILIALSRLMFSIGISKPWNILLPPKLLALDLADRLSADPPAIESASRDFGNIVNKIPAAVLYPTSSDDIAALIKFANKHSAPFHVAARGCGHSTRGQAMVENGVVVEMTSLNTGIAISGNSFSGFTADVGGGQLWIDVLKRTMEEGLAPVSWTDYLYLTVGGTLSNAGISGQTFRYGPQISNVHEMDVINGKGELLTCSAEQNADLFYAVLGGLGQFGIITRARIPLKPAPKRVKWIRMLYTDFSTFTRDQEHLISINGDKAVDFVEGTLMMDHGSPENWRSSFFPPSDHSRLISLITKHGIIYCLEIVKHYDDQTLHVVHQELEMILKDLNFIRGFMFEKDVSYVEFLNRVRGGELKLKSQGQWEVPHPWLNLFIPKSHMKSFNEGVFKDIVLKRNITKGLVIIYPMNRNKWDDRMSVVIPDEEVFYTVGFLHSGGIDDEWEALDEQNKEILRFCEEVGIEIKQYLPHYCRNKEDWIKQFGSKWSNFVERKNMFDPKCILSPGQGIFNINNN